MLRARLLSPLDLTADDVAHWRTLLDADPRLSSPYLTPDYAQLIAHVRPGDSRVAVLERNDTPVGYLPFRQAGRHALPLGAPMCDVQGLVASTDITAGDLITALGVRRIEFDHALAHQALFAGMATAHKVSHILDISNGYDGYLAARAAAGSKIAQRVGKKARKIEREIAPLRIEASDTQADFQQLLAWKEAQYRATGALNLFRWPWTRQVLERAFTTTTPHFAGRFYALHIGETLAAAAFNLATPRTLHAWFVAYDPALSAHSPGQILFLKMAEIAAAQGVQTLDLGAGDYRFKTELATGGIDLCAGSLGQTRLSHCASQQIARLPLGPASRLPSRVLRRLDLYRALSN